MGDTFYVKVVFNAVSPSLRRVTAGNFDCAISDSLAKCTRDFAKKFSEDPNILEEGKRANTVIQQEKEKPHLIYGFLNVFPSDIGRYEKIPKEIMKKINASDAFKDQDCEDWRVPTENEIVLLASEGLILKTENYMTDKTGNGHLRPVASCKKSKDSNEVFSQQNLVNYSQPEVIYGFLKVFPKDIGEYNRRPTEIVEKINSSSESGIYGCKNWRIPTENEVALLASRGIVIKAEEYLSSNGKSKGSLRLVADMPGYETEPEEDTDNKDNESYADEKHDNVEEPESGAKLKQDSRSKPENSTVKHSSKGCAADIL